MTITERHVDSGDATAYPADLYTSDKIATMVPSADAIGDADIARFRAEGFLAVESLLSSAEVDEVLDGLAAVLSRDSGAHVQYESWAADRVDAASGEERMDLVRKFMWFTTEDPRLESLARHPKIISVIQRLTGSSDLAMMQDMALLKPPGGGREKPWHQDNAYFTYEPGTPIIGAWIALDAATAENGCMHVLPGTHTEGPVVHFARRDWQLCDSDVDRARDTTVPLPPGGVLFFHALLHHGTPTNDTDTRRRAVQLHYVPASTPRIPDERRLEIFGSEGRDVTC